MKNIFAVLFAVMLVFGVTSIGLANGDSDDDSDGFAGGSGTAGAGVFGAGIDAAGEGIPNGGAFGISGAIGGAMSGVGGFIIDGFVSGDVTVIGGGLTNTDAYVFNPGIGDFGIGVGSSSFSQAVTGGSASVFVDPDDGFGAAGGGMKGFAAQGTLNMSGLGESPFFFNSTGSTGGIAMQGSMGGFSGHVFAVSSGDTEDHYFGRGDESGAGWYVKRHGNNAGRIRYFANGHPNNESEWDFLGRWRAPGENSNAGANIDVSIDMWGDSFSNSYRFVDIDGNMRTEGMGTNVGAFTEVRTSGDASSYDNGDAYAGAYVRGGWVAGGMVSTTTTQSAPGMGGAFASASGSYFGAGSLGTNYSGSATGYSSTSITTVNGMNGSINTAAAGMSVTSIVD